VRGTPAVTACLAPTIAPAEIGAPGERPWDPSPPDVIVFLADTFRADNLGFHGGTLDLTPNLDRFARASLACRKASSVGTFTLSAHATMFTGVYPHQAGVFGEENAVSEELETLAEFLAAAGYRTGAITDGGIVSQAFALDQGFATFDEGRRPLEESVAAAQRFLAADDGRPVFLFLHTYRVHRAYRVSAETRAEHGARLGIEGEFEALEAELVALARGRGYASVARAQDFPPELVELSEAQALLARLRAHYQGCVIDLDREFERFRGFLEARGFFAHGNLVFTSDHGEAFGEHRQLYHKDDVYEEQTEIPFLLAGQGVRPGVLEAPVSLLDLAPTVADLAGLERPPAWLGRSLRDPPEERVLYSFECSRRAATSTFALRSGTRKLIGFEDRELLRAGRLLGAFDLHADPAERRDLAATEPWPQAELTRHRATIERYLQPLIDTRRADLEPEKRSELDDLGYGGDG
jgi:arylsulfatase A-like enzyme